MKLTLEKQQSRKVLFDTFFCFGKKVAVVILDLLPKGTEAEMKSLQAEPAVAVVKDRAIRASGDYRSSPFFLRSRENGRLNLMPLGDSRTPEEALRIARERGYEPTHLITVDNGKRYITKFADLPVAGTPTKPMKIGMAA
tara:strand:- start:5091 stop:5510 length:420 start_codon:yes stop_codon:yes gene_type:complete